MFSIFKRKRSVANIFDFINTDIHNHLLPGIDDGSPDVQTSLRLAEVLFELGFKKFVCTPHIIADLYPNTPETISGAWKEFSTSLELAQVGNFHYAAEYFVDYGFENRIESGQLLTFGAENYILIEMSYLMESINIREAIFGLITNGYQPILAHPERYGYFHQRFHVYQDLFDAGCQFQLNLLSLKGHYGSKIKLAAEKLIEEGLISWVGTDMHHLAHADLLQELALDKKAIRQLQKIKNLQNSLLEL